MGNREEFIVDYWNYYLLLEEKFCNTLNYVELCRSNFATYSKEYTSQIYSIGAELDIVLKKICGKNQNDNIRMPEYIEYINENEAEILDIEVTMKEFKIKIKPFEEFKNNNSNNSNNNKIPFWWKAYNKLKHGRQQNKKSGNLKNVLFLLSALYILEMYYIKKISGEEKDIPDQASKLFSLGENWTKYMRGSEVDWKVIDEF